MTRGSDDMPRTELEILPEEIARAEHFEQEIGELRCRRLLGEDVSEAMQLAKEDLHTAVVWPHSTIRGCTALRFIEKVTT